MTVLSYKCAYVLNYYYFFFSVLLPAENNKTQTSSIIILCNALCNIVAYFILVYCSFFQSRLSLLFCLIFARVSLFSYRFVVVNIISFSIVIKI